MIRDPTGVITSCDFGPYVYVREMEHGQRFSSNCVKLLLLCEINWGLAPAAVMCT